MRALLRDRNFRLLAIGQLLNVFGDTAMIFAFGIWVKTLTHSNAQAGLVILALAAPALAGPLLGVFVDRFPRRPILIANDVAVAIAVLTLLSVHDRGDVWLLFAVAGFYGLSGQMYAAARSGLLVSMLPDEYLGDANGLLQSIQQGVRLGAPLVGAALFALWGGGAVAVLDAATFLASVALLVLLSVPDLRRLAPPVGFWIELREGLAHMWRERDLRLLVGVTAAVVAVLGASEVAIYGVIDQGLHRPPAFLGVILTIQGMGAVAGGITAAAILRRIGELGLAGLALALAAGGAALFVAASLATVSLGAAVFGAAVSYFMVGYSTLFQRRTANELQGRVMSAADAVVTLPYTLSIGVGAALIAVLDFRVIYLAAAVALGAGAIPLLRVRAPAAAVVADDPEAV